MHSSRRQPFLQGLLERAPWTLCLIAAVLLPACASTVQVYSPSPGGVPETGRVVSGKDGASPGSLTVAYSWTEVEEDLGNIVPFHWLRLADYRDPGQAVLMAKEAADAMPEGRRVLFSWDLHRIMSYHPDDNLRDGAGNNVGHTDGTGRFHPYRSLWWDHGVEDVRLRFEDFFRRYFEAGGKVDILILDFEQGLSTWHLLMLAERDYDGDVEGYLAALERDPRFPALGREAGLADLRPLLEWNKSDDYLRWNAFMGERIADFMNRAVYEPVREFFPDIRMSNYGYFSHHRDFPVPDRNGHRTYLYGKGAVVGTHQSRNIYGWPGNIRYQFLDGEWRYAATPFNAFRYAVNKLRAMKLSSRTPIHPWVANKEFGESLLKDSDFYQELIFHTVLTGVDEILFWNPTGTGTPATAASNRLLSECLTQADTLTGFGDRETLVHELVEWGEDYVLTGISAGGRAVWRFTPRLKGAPLESVLVEEFPATFRVKGKKIVVEGGRVFLPESRLSRQGYWVIVEGGERFLQAAE